MATPPRQTRASGQPVANAETARGGLFARIQLGPALRSDSSDVIMLLGSTLFLVAFGLVMVLSSSSITSFLNEQGFFGGFWRQALFALIGIPLMLGAGRVAPELFKKFAWFALIGALALQLLVFTSLGIETYGNRNWVSIGGISGQPSEFLKLALIVWMATVLYAKRDLLMQTKHVLVPAVLGAVLAMGLVVAGRDLGTTMVMAMITFAALYFAGVRWRLLLTLAGLAGLAIALLAITSPNRMRRITTYCGDLDRADYSGVCWQPLHGMWALADGRLFGVGLGGSKTKWSWLPAADNDYIFAIIGEELGLIGAVVVLIAFGVLGFAMLRILRRATDLFGVIVVGSVFIWVIGQAFINIGVVLGILPVLGVPLPLISSGGTALIANLLGIGVVLSIAREADRDARSGHPHGAAESGRRW